MLENESVISGGLWLFYLLFFVSIGAAVLMPLAHAVKSPKTFVKSLYGVAALVVLFGISYVLTGSNVTPAQQAIGITESTSKMIGAGLTLFYILLFGSILGIIYSEISKALK
jgi:uncharacterized membrane protein